MDDLRQERLKRLAENLGDIGELMTEIALRNVGNPLLDMIVGINVTLGHLTTALVASKAIDATDVAARLWPEWHRVDRGDDGPLQALAIETVLKALGERFPRSRTTVSERTRPWWLRGIANGGGRGKGARRGPRKKPRT